MVMLIDGRLSVRLCGLAEIGGYDALIGMDILRRAFGKHGAAVEHRDATEIAITTRMWCSISSTVTPRSDLIRSINATRPCASAGFMPAAGSSRSSSRGSVAARGRLPAGADRHRAGRGRSCRAARGCRTKARSSSAAAQRSASSRGNEGSRDHLPHRRLHFTMAADEHVVVRGQIGEQADVLVGAGDAVRDDGGAPGHRCARRPWRSSRRSGRRTTSGS